MKKIINGRQYNTDTATKLGGWSSPGSYSDFNHYEETLYQKRTGEFFLFGEGGANSKYAVSQGMNSWSGGCEIIPLSWEAAQKWAEEHLSADEYESIFGPVSEDDSRTVVTMTMSVASLEKAKRAAAKAGMTLSAYIESLI